MHDLALAGSRLSPMTELAGPPVSVVSLVALVTVSASQWYLKLNLLLHEAVFFISHLTIKHYSKLSALPTPLYPRLLQYICTHTNRALN